MWQQKRKRWNQYHLCLSSACVYIKNNGISMWQQTDGMESVSFLPVFCLSLHKNVIKFHKEQNQTSKDFIVFKKMGYLFSVVLLCKCSLNRLMLNLYSSLSASTVHIVVIALLFYYYNIYCFIFRKIRELPGLTSFDRVRMFMDTDFSITDQFTVSHSKIN